MPGQWPELVPLPPSNVTGPLGQWLLDLANTLNAHVPRASFFSGDTPNSRVTAIPGYLAINMSPSADTENRLFIKSGTGITPTTISWATVRTLS